MQARVQTEQHTELYELYHSQPGDSDTGLNSTFATASHTKNNSGGRHPAAAPAHYQPSWRFTSVRLLVHKRSDINSTRHK